METIVYLMLNYSIITGLFKEMSQLKLHQSSPSIPVNQNDSSFDQLLYLVPCIKTLEKVQVIIETMKVTVQFFCFLLPLKLRFLQYVSCFFSSTLTFHKVRANHADCWRVVFLIFSMVGILFLQVTFKFPEGRSYYFLFLQCFSTAQFNVLYPLL